MSIYALSTICPKCSEHFKIENGQAIPKQKVATYPFPIEKVELAGIAQELQNEASDNNHSSYLPSSASPASTSILPSPLPQAEFPSSHPNKETIDSSDTAGSPLPQSATEPESSINEEIIEEAPKTPETSTEEPLETLEPKDDHYYAESKVIQSLDELPPAPPPKDHEIALKCFECAQVHNVHENSSSSLCPRCGFYISLRDYKIKTKWTQQIKTRGDVFIAKKGIVNNLSIQAHNLTVEGHFAGSASCTGDLIIRQHAKILGPVECQKLIIESKADVQFADQVHASEVSVDGLAAGNISCTGRLALEANAQLIGDIHARTISMQDGAAHKGRVTMISDEEAISNILDSVRESFKEHEEHHQTDEGDEA